MSEPVDTHDPAGMAAFMRERAKANREIAELPREQWPYRPAVLQHWAFRFEQGAELIEHLVRDNLEEITKRLQMQHERDCAVEDVARLVGLLRKCEPYLTDIHGDDVPLLGEVRSALDVTGEQHGRD